MQKKLSKHFIYNWLEEDLYGEYMLHKFSNNFSQKLLLNLWNFLTNRRLSSRHSLVPASRLTRQIDFAAAALRLGNLNTTSIRAKASIINRFSQRFLTKVRIYFSNGLNNVSKLKYFKRYKILPSLVLSKISKKSRQPFNRKVAQYVFTLASVKYHWRKTRRMLRSRFTIIRRRRRFLKIINSKKSSISRNNKVLNVRKKFPHSMSNNSRTVAFMVSFLKKLRKKPRKRVSRILKSVIYQRRFLWRFYNEFTAPGSTIIKILNRSNTNIRIFSCQSLASTWDNLAYKLKQKVNKFTQTSKYIRKGILNASYAKLKFKGIFKKSQHVVKKNEITELLRFRLLNYFNLIDTAADLKKNGGVNYKVYYKAKVLQLPQPSAFEFYLSPLLLRSGFFENGYIANSLIRRGVVLVNGVVVNHNISLTVWDIIALSPTIKWLVYARFINFFTSFSNKRWKRMFTAPISSVFIKRILRIKTLFKKTNFRYRGFSIAKGERNKLSKLVNSKNFIFSLPPTYMEISYKLFIIVVYKLINKSSDVNLPFNLRGIKSILPTLNNRVLNI